MATFRKPHKYRAQPVIVDGIRFDSKREAARYGELVLLARAGQIRALDVHPVFVLQDKFTRPDGKRVRAIKYEGDFAYVENGKQVVEDTKGVETQVFRLKQKMFWKRYPHIELRVIR